MTFKNVRGFLVHSKTNIKINNMGFFDQLFGNSRNEASGITPFVFHSGHHQRYQNGTPVMGLQACGRTVQLEKNTNGCKGYRIQPGDGYIVKIFNDDLGKPNMSDKPMRVVSQSPDKIELRGYLLDAMGPFGWVEVDYNDYGLTVYLTNGNVEKCVFHMFDRGVDLEYTK